MSVIISHQSALDYYRGHPRWRLQACAAAEPVPLPTTATVQAARSFIADELARGNTVKYPLHVLCSKRSRSHASASLIVHRTTHSELPARSCYGLGEDRYLCSPELMFCQMCARLPLLSCIVLGYEICGGYSHYAPLVSGFYEREPLTTAGRIAGFIKREDLPRMYGRTNARKALRHILDGSASPMETVLACMLTLPASMGGEGLPAPRLNHEIALDSTAASLTGTRCARVDAAWPKARVGLEYDSDAHHPDPAHDRRRREALAHMGWRIVTVDTGQIGNAGELRKTLSLVRTELGLVQEEEKQTVDSRRLFSALMKLTRADLGMAAALFQG